VAHDTATWLRLNSCAMCALCKKKRKGQCVPLQPNALLVDLRADLVNELLHLIVGEVDPFFLKQFLDAAAQVRTFLGGKKQCYAAANYGAAKECV